MKTAKGRWLIFALILRLAGSSFATVDWQGGYDANLWNAGANWSTDTVPTDIDAVRLSNLAFRTNNPVVDSSVDCTHNTVTMFAASEAFLKITGGTLATSSYFSIAQNIDTFSTVNMSGGTINVGTSLRV